MDIADRYDHKEGESRWRKAWEEARLDTPDIAKAKKSFYNLMMFPYPSAEGLHVGNMYAFTGSDIYGRFKRMHGYDVFEPIGLDGFGIHSENFALKIGRHPMDHAGVTQKNFYNQLHAIGAMFDWTRTVETYDPSYYKWTQWIFIQMYRHGLAYRAKAKVNWCPSCKTVLADEQVIDEKCERCGNTIQKRELEQWFFKITAYAEKLLQNSYSLDWSEKVRVAQQAWIGKKEGIHITYNVVDSASHSLGHIPCFTTRPDTNFGATFVVMAPEHPFVEVLLRGKGDSSIQAGAPDNAREATVSQIKEYMHTSANKTAQDRIAAGRKKTGVFTGFYCENGLNGSIMPLYISDFVLMGVGTGAVVGVPGHDKRDFEFAMQFDIPIVRVVVAPDGDTSIISRIEQVQEDEGIMVNSGFLDGMDIHEAKEKMMDYLEDKGQGKRITTYHLRDWLISRQRYWGPPIPMIYCERCGKEGNGTRAEMPGWYTVSEADLPVVLPRIDDYKPGDDGVAPLAKHTEFYETKCPGCGGKAVRETDVSDTFLDSSWYFLRYPSVGDMGSGKAPFDPEITKKWLPVPMYTGGAEHSVLHLMYSRFVTMALHDWGYINFDEPFTTFYAHGLVIKDGAKMSKSKGNVVNPDEYIANYGADALRLYLMFTGPFDQGGDFRDSAMEGMSRWVQKVWRMAQKSMSKHSMVSSATIKKALHIAIKKVGEDIERRRYNTAISAMMVFVNIVADDGGVMGYNDLRYFLQILAPFAPFMTEELYQQMSSDSSYNFDSSAEKQSSKNKDTKNSNVEEAENISQYTFTKSNSIHFQPWPAYDPKLLEEDTVEIAVQVNGKLRDMIVVESQKSKVQSEVEAETRASQKVVKHLEGKSVKKIIFVPGRLINFVA